MARIRSIKPEFWRDGKIARITKQCALFFIGLWNFCDDEGKCETDSLELSLKLPLFRSQDIVKHISQLYEAGLVRLSINRDWLLVQNWEHQKIDKPKKPKVSKEDIQWLEPFTPGESPKSRRSVGDKSSKSRRKDRIGEDRIGSGADLFSEGVAPATSARPVEAEVVTDETPDQKSLGARIWDAYRAAVQKRWRFDPPANPTVRGQCAQIGKRLGEEAIPAIEFFVAKNNDQYLLKTHHPVGAFLKNAESYHGQWQRGQVVTTHQAQTFERQAGNAELLAKVREGRA